MMTEFEFSKRVIFREYPAVMATLVLNELMEAVLVLLGIGTFIPFLGGLLGGNKELPGPVGKILIELGLSDWSNTKLLAVLVTIMFLRIILDAFRLYLVGWIDVKLNRFIKTRMCDSLTKLDWQGFSSIDQGRYLQCMIAEGSLARGAVSDLASAFAYGLIAVLLLIALAVQSFNMFLIFIALGVLFMWSSKRLLWALRSGSHQRIELMSVMNTKLVEMRCAFKMLLAENSAGVMGSAIKSLIAKIANVERSQLFLSVLLDNYVNFFGLVVIAGILTTNIVLGVGNGSALLFDLILVQRIASYFTGFQTKRKAMLQKIPSYEASLDMMDMGSKYEKNTKYSDIESSFDEGINLENVSFSYNRARKILKNVNAEFPKSGIVFLVGPSGSGKTTMMDILIGLLAPEIGGNVLIDGKDKKELDSASWSKLISYVPQEAYMFSGTIREYLCFGCAEVVTDEKIWKALRLANAESIILALECGLDSKVQSGGTNFSGGERHRLSIARALIRDSKIIFLDEPSSALDKESELAVFSALRSLKSEMLIVVVTHSREVISKTDYVYEFNDGELVASNYQNVNLQNHERFL